MAWNYMTLKSPKAKRFIGYFVALSSFFINIWLFYKKVEIQKIKSILVIKLDHLGDVLLATPVIKNLRKCFPKAHISVMIGSWAKPIIEKNPYIDEIILYDSTFYNRRGRKNAKVISNIRKLLLIRKIKLDLIVDLRPSPGTLFLAIITHGKYRFDRSTVSIKAKIAKICSNNKKDTLVKHEVEQNLDVLRDIGIEITDRKPLIIVSDDDEKYATVILHQHNVRPTDFVVAIIPGAEWKYRRWKTDRFAKIGDWLIQRYNAKVIILGSSEDNELAKQICNQMNEKQINLVGKTTVGQLAAILKQCNLFIGNESGPMHIAAAVDTFVVALFGPQSSDRFRPHGEKSFFLEGDVKCKPCDQVNCRRPDDHCMDKISVEDVLQAIERIVLNRM